jgi:hypothetical protein
MQTRVPVGAVAMTRYRPRTLLLLAVLAALVGAAVSRQVRVSRQQARVRAELRRQAAVLEERAARLRAHRAAAAANGTKVRGR